MATFDLCGDMSLGLSVSCIDGIIAGGVSVLCTKETIGWGYWLYHRLMEVFRWGWRYYVLMEV